MRPEKTTIKREIAALFAVVSPAYRRGYGSGKNDRFFRAGAHYRRRKRFGGRSRRRDVVDYYNFFTLENRLIDDFKTIAQVVEPRVSRKPDLTYHAFFFDYRVIGKRHARKRAEGFCQLPALVISALFLAAFSHRHESGYIRVIARF